MYKHLGIVPWLLSFLATIVCYSIASFSVRRRRLVLKKSTAISEMTYRVNQIRLRNENRFLSTIFIITIEYCFDRWKRILCDFSLAKYNFFTMETISDNVTFLYDLSDMLFLLNLVLNPFSAVL